MYQRLPAKPKMTTVGAVLRYSHIAPTFDNSSHGRPSSRKPYLGFPAENHTLVVVLPEHHIWAPHTKQRAVFSKSSRSRASTTLVVEHHCPKGCSGHPSYVDGIHVPLLRKVENVSGPERSKNSNWQHFTERPSQVLPRRISHLVRRISQEVSDTKVTSTHSGHEDSNEGR